MADITTIKVSKPLRDRINAAAAHREQTVQGFMEQMMDELDRRERLTAVATAIGSANDETLGAWRLETADWASVDIDMTDTP
jgi:hypothetical protein